MGISSKDLKLSTSEQLSQLAPNARTNISPSDLTFSWDGCHRCLWLYYSHQIKPALFMPLVGDLANMQEINCLNKSSAELHADMPAGRAIDHGGWVQSTPIVVDGTTTPYAIRGKYDLLMEMADGSYGIIDCKFQARDNDKSSFYSPQLEAYAFALENPAKGEPKKISTLGLLVWSPVKIRGTSSGNFGMELRCSWYPIERNPEALQVRLREFIHTVTGDAPASDDKCDQCNYIAARKEVLG